MDYHPVFIPCKHPGGSQYQGELIHPIASPSQLQGGTAAGDDSQVSTRPAGGASFQVAGLLFFKRGSRWDWQLSGA